MATISSGDKILVDKLRDFLRDRAELNTLLEREESTDQDLYQYLLDGMDYINSEVGFQTSYTISSFPSWKILRDAATMQMLLSAGIGSARNTLTYNDSGGITVQDSDVYGRYVNYYNMLTNVVRTAVTNFKVQYNLENGFSGVESAFSTVW